MKILKIAFENINSLKGYHEIDFSEEPFLSNSLFAITGPTGSGKSSILDVISLALFNQVPRLGKITRNEIQSKGAILTRNQKNAMVRVTYECNKGTYSSQWSIEVNRNGNLNDYEMEIHDHISGKLLDLKKSLIPTKNEDLIGLNYNQFIKAVLLAQGEFAQFLKAKKEERGELLEKITGTGIYRKLGIKAFERNKDANRAIQEQQNEIQVIQKDLLDEELLESHKIELEKKQLLGQQIQKEIDVTTKAIELKKTIETQKIDIKKLRESEELANQELKTFDAEHGAPLKQHEKVQTESEKLREWNLLRKSLKENQDAATKVKQQIETNKDQAEAIIKQTSALLHEEVTAAEINLKLNDFRDKVLKLQETKKNKLNSYAAKKEQLRSELRDTGITFKDKDLKAFVTDLSEELQQSKQQTDALKLKFQIDPEVDLKREQQDLKFSIKTSRDAIRAFSTIDVQKKEILKIQQELEILEPRILQFPKQLKELGKSREVITERLENRKLRKENLLLKASLEEHRKNLQDGEPCPLCGAIHHPFAGNLLPEDNTLDQEIAQLEIQLEKANQDFHKIEAEYANLSKNKADLEQKLETLKTSCNQQKVEFANKFADYTVFESQVEMENFSGKLEEKFEGLMALENQTNRLSALERSIPIAQNLQEILESGKRLKIELEHLYTGKDIQNDTQQISNIWTRLEQERSGLVQRMEEINLHLHKDDSNLKDLVSTLNESIKLNGFSTINDAWNALIPEAKVVELRTEKQKLLKSIDDTKASIKVLENQLENSKKLDTEIDFDVLVQQLNQNNEKHSNLNKDCRELERILKNQQERILRMETLKLEIAEKEKQTKRWRLLNELIGDSKGKAFNDFAQDLTLSQLLIHANIRLKGLSDRYLIDKPSTAEDDGLVAVDEHMGGQRRSVKTLSGGETFLLSLSMALALSDLASKNVDINSLFIDEGFGTLDPETLDTTLDTLEKLQAESNKTIGIISHVDSLKERIATQIQLQRNGQGYSSLNITGK